MRGQRVNSVPGFFLFGGDGDSFFFFLRKGWGNVARA